MDFGKKLNVFYSQKAQGEEIKEKAKRNVFVWGAVAIVSFFLEAYIWGLVCIAMVFVCLYYSSKPQNTRAQLEIWEKGYVLKAKDGKVYRVSYEKANMPTVAPFAKSFLVKVWDDEAVKHSHLFEVESMEKGREICEMIDEAAKKVGVNIS